MPDKFKLLTSSFMIIEHMISLGKSESILDIRGRYWVLYALIVGAGIRAVQGLFTRVNRRTRLIPVLLGQTSSACLNRIENGANSSYWGGPIDSFADVLAPVVVGQWLWVNAACRWTGSWITVGNGLTVNAPSENKINFRVYNYKVY